MLRLSQQQVQPQHRQQKALQPMHLQLPPQQRLAPLEEPRPPQSKESKEDELLDIPAFLRRQAN